jgi:tetratricopeptide (TPR) repeat protein
MTTDDPSPADDAFADRLAALDDAIAAGATAAPFADDTPPDLRERLARGVAALRELQHLRPAGRHSLTPRPPLPQGERGREFENPLPPPSPLVGEGGRGGEGTSPRIGRFTILRELGCGGFGVVFLAHDPTLHREVALKVPHAHVLLSPDLRDRFRREALAASGLDHPNLIPVHEVDDAGPVCYIASAYCPGPSLAEWLSRRPAVLAVEAAAFVATLAEAIAHAHSRGVVHRDLKPANILLGNDVAGLWGGENRPPDTPSPPHHRTTPRSLSLTDPKICDFGLARLAGDLNRVTRTSAGLGTPAYMAPEQAAAAKDAGTAADQYALGAILYELLTGRPPFRGETDLDTLRQVAECDPVPPRQLRPGLPRDLDTICLKCLEKNPAKRYPSAVDLAADLRRFVAGRPIAARPVGSVGRTVRWCRRKPVVAGLSAALILAVVTGGAAVWREYRRAERERDAAVAERDRAHRLLGQSHAALGRLRDLGEDQHSLAQMFGSASARTGDDRHCQLIDDLDQARLDMVAAGWESSIGSMAEIVARQRAAVAASPNARNLALDLAMALEWLSATYYDGERWADAEKHCREALGLRQRPPGGPPATAAELIELAQCWSRIGATLMAAGRLTEAEGPYLEANRIYDRAVAAASDDPATYHHYAKHLFNVWRLYDKLRPAGRISVHRKLVVVRTQLVRLQPNSGRRKTELAWAHYHLARQADELGDTATARSELAAARDMLAAEIPADQAADMRNLAKVAAELGRRLDGPAEP